jgi:transcriptional regulator with XRE-family HTH domain
MDTTGFGTRLRQLREAAGQTREQLAERAGLKFTSIRDIEQGVYSPNWATVVSLCRALGVTPTDFLPEQADRQEKVTSKKKGT